MNPFSTLLEFLTAVIAQMAASKNPAYAPLIQTATPLIDAEIEKVTNGTPLTPHAPDLPTPVIQVAPPLPTSTIVTQPVVTPIPVPTLNPPVINSPLSATAKVGELFQYQIGANPTPAHTQISAEPSGMSLTNEGNIVWIPQTPGTFSVTLIATNSDGSDVKTLNISAT